MFLVFAGHLKEKRAKNFDGIVETLACEDERGYDSNN